MSTIVGWAILAVTGLAGTALVVWLAVGASASSLRDRRRRKDLRIIARRMISDLVSYRLWWDNEEWENYPELSQGDFEEASAIALKIAGISGDPDGPGVPNFAGDDTYQAAYQRRAQACRQWMEDENGQLER